MAKHQIYRTRSPNELRPNRETRQSVRQRAERVTFGMYLPLLTDIEQTAGRAVKDATDFMAEERRGPSAEMIPHDDFGLTLAHKTQVGHSIRDMMGRGFALEHLVEAFQAAPDAVGYESIEVPISGFEWVGTGRRKLAARIDEESVAFAALVNQAAAVEETLGEVRGGDGVVVRVPHHISVATYGRPRDGMSLSRTHRRNVADIFHGGFLSERGPDGLVLTLGSLVVGTSYSKPFEGMELKPLLPAAELVESFVELDELDEELAGAGFEFSGLAG